MSCHEKSVKLSPRDTEGLICKDDVLLSVQVSNLFEVSQKGTYVRSLKWALSFVSFLAINFSKRCHNR